MASFTQHCCLNIQIVKLKTLPNTFNTPSNKVFESKCNLHIQYPEFQIVECSKQVIVIIVNSVSQSNKLNCAISDEHSQAKSLAQEGSVNKPKSPMQRRQVQRQIKEHSKTKISEPTSKTASRPRSIPKENPNRRHEMNKP